MSIDNHLYLDTRASRHELRDAVVRAEIGFEASPDFERLSGAMSDATDITIRDDLSGQNTRWDNGVIANRVVSFHFRKKGSDLKFWDEYDTQTTRGIVALLKAFPDADAFWVSLDAEIPMLLRRAGRLVLSQAETATNEFWNPERDPSCVAMVDLPYTIEPLGPWEDIDIPLAERARLRPTT